MSDLLVSVRCAAECQVALSCGVVDVIDVKEPDRGALGAADPLTVQAVVSAVQGRVPVSVAMGELLDLSSDQRVVAGVQFAKVGLAGCARWSEWPQAWQEFGRTQTNGSQLVAVAYADHLNADSPPWHEVVRQARLSSCPVLLVDTFDKRAGRLLDWLSVDQLRVIQRAAADAGMRCALAGSLTVDDVAWIAEQVRPDWVAVRSAACPAGRQSQISASAVQQLAAALGRTGSQSMSSINASSRRFSANESTRRGIRQ